MCTGRANRVPDGAIELYTKDNKLPLELRTLAYDVNSVMHFGERDYSKNGHKTILFKDESRSPVKQNRNGLSSLDLRKIELIYGQECRQRDRQEKLELCQNYPGAARRKREVDDSVNLRVNRDITPPPEESSTNLNDSLKLLGIQDEVQEVVDQVYKVTAKALRNARIKYCNATKPDLRSVGVKVPKNESNPDIIGVIEAIANYAQSTVDHAVANLTQFCADSENITIYQRARGSCPFFGAPDCPKSYRSTKSGRVKASTQHRPVYIQSTKHPRKGYRKRSADIETDANVNRKKRDTDTKDSATTEGRRRDDDMTTIYLKSRDDEVRDGDTHGGRRDDVTRVIIMRSKDGTTEAGDRKDNDNDGKSDRDVATPDADDGRREEGTNGERANDEKASQKPEVVPNVAEHGNGSKLYLRTGTDIPVRHKKQQFVAEWPFPERHHRRNDKLRKKAKSKSRQEEESELTIERERMSREGENVEQWRGKKAARFENKQRVTPRQQRERPQNNHEGSSEPEDQVNANHGSSEDAAKGGDLPPITVTLSKANKEFYSERKWPDGVVRYVLKDTDNYDMADVRRRLDEVNQILQEKTCARIEEVTEEQAKDLTDYLVLDTSADFVTGRVGGRQTFGCLELFRGGQHRQHAAMLVMSMLGFYFELARHDRDKFVRVHLRHVRPDKLHHFEKIRADATFPLEYDFASATHPAWQFWRKVGRTGISTVATYKSQDKKGEVMKSLGQHSRLLSELDLVKINSVYGTTCFRRRDKTRVRPNQSRQ